jgi:hypothetical protein
LNDLVSDSSRHPEPAQYVWMSKPHSCGCITIDAHALVSLACCMAGDLREMQGELKQAQIATAALAAIGGDAQAQADSMAELCAKLTKEVEGLAKQLGTCKQRDTPTDACAHAHTWMAMLFCDWRKSLRSVLSLRFLLPMLVAVQLILAAILKSCWHNTARKGAVQR